MMWDDTPPGGGGELLAGKYSRFECPFFGLVESEQRPWAGQGTAYRNGRGLYFFVFI